MSSNIPEDRDIAKLMIKHKDQVEELKRLTKHVIPAPDKDGNSTDGFWLKYDDLFFLRYIASYKKAKDCHDLVEKCVKHRSDPSNHKIIKDVMNGQLKTWPEFQDYNKVAIFHFFSSVQQDGGLSPVVKGDLGHRDDMYDIMPREDLFRIQAADRELMYFHNDAQTRKTGYLAKSVLMFDMTDIPMSQMMDKRQGSIFGDVSALSAFLYPQLLEKTCIINAPSWMAMVVNVFKAILPKRAMDKVQVFSSTKALWSSDWGKQTLSRRGTPDFIGGDLKEYPDQYRSSVVDYETNFLMRSVTVSARSSEKISFDVSEAASVMVTLSVQSHGIEFQAVLQHGKGKGDACTNATGDTTVFNEQRKIKFEECGVKLLLTCDVPGVLVINLDNSYSKMRSKTIKYRFEVVAKDVNVSDLEEKAQNLSMK
eukprot:m.263253 g.263253  ORF g.263253 m.263253 type:complete len:423 (-) comp49504_c0_seq1:129-1397(-)